LRFTFVRGVLTNSKNEETPLLTSANQTVSRLISPRRLLYNRPWHSYNFIMARINSKFFSGKEQNRNKAPEGRSKQITLFVAVNLFSVTPPSCSRCLVHSLRTNQHYFYYMSRSFIEIRLVMNKCEKLSLNDYYLFFAAFIYFSVLPKECEFCQKLFGVRRALSIISFLNDMTFIHWNLLFFIISHQVLRKTGPGFKHQLHFG
jgi:hypothetical protein